MSCGIFCDVFSWHLKDIIVLFLTLSFHFEEELCCLSLTLAPDSLLDSVFFHSLNAFYILTAKAKQPVSKTSVCE